MLPIEAAYKVFTDLDGKPLSDGYVYIGQPSQNPITGPAQVYWDADGTIPASQPLRTLNGYVMRSGTPATVFCDQSYSVLVQDSRKQQVYYATNSDEFSAGGILAGLNNLAQGSGSSKIGFLQSGIGAIVRTVQSKLRDFIGPQDFGGSADAAFSSALTEIGQSQRELDMGGRTITLSVTPTNTYGVKVRDGKVLSPSLIGGKNTQLNTYAPDINGLMVGRENLAYFWKFATLTTPFNVYFYGDSTVELGPGWPVKSHELFQMALQDAGVNNSKVYNRGVSGTSWSDLNAIPDLGAATYLIIIKYGINDAVKNNPLATIAADMRAKLAAIRSAPRGGITQLSILLMGPNSSYSPSANQDAKWYEDLRKIYVQIAQEFDCAYFDTYAYLQQTRRAPGFWMDDLTSLGKPGESLHPDQFAVYWIYRAALKDHVLGDGGWNAIKANNFWNLSNYTKPAQAADFPNTYQLGLIMQLAMTANGFPLSGVLRTDAFADGSVVQTISTTDVVPRTASRRGTAGVWAQWSGVPTPITVFANGWAAKGGGYADPGYQVQSDGFIELYGHIAGGASSTVAFNLPSNVSPAFSHVFSAANSATVTVFNNGQVSVTTSDTTMVSLAGIRFRAL